MSRYAVLKGLYEVEKSIGSGGFAKVKLGTHLLTREKVAIKIMDKSRLGDDLPRVKIELEALKCLPHQNICKLYQVIETETHYYLILEYCSGGELFDHIVERNRLEEKESRVFFRQIVSAVAYLHEKGYAHRDLKPENVLLDKDRNLKLIDFGLCAKPQLGLDSFLYTSCGSPTYAAPELILGQKYLGSEVDIWSLGILLYALLCGLLPFDEENIDSLYRKILSGRYEEPPWLSSESKQLIRSMLQVDPKKRITIDELLSHPWLMKGFTEKVKKDSLHKIREKDPLCVNILAQYYGVSSDVMWSKLNTWKYDYDTATYMLLLSKKQRGHPVKLARLPLKIKMGNGLNGIDYSPNVKGHVLNSTLCKLNSQCITPKCYDLQTTYLILNGRESTPDKELALIGSMEDHRLDSIHTQNNSEEQENSTPSLRYTPIGRKPHKRLWSPGPNEAHSPVPSKLKAHQNVGDPHAVVNNLQESTCGGDDAINQSDDSCSTSTSATTNSHSSTSGAPDAVAGGREEAGGACESPRCSKVLGSIERSLHRMRHMLTPRRRPAFTHGEVSQPALLSAKEVCNVSTTSYNDPDTVLEELRKALLKKGIACRQKKRFTLRGKLQAAPAASAARVPEPCRLSFELEVCLVAAPDSVAPPLVGIRRKRLKGDAWCYKRVVEEVLAMAKS